MYKRFWLNRGRGHAFMEASVDDFQGKTYVDVNVIIADCTRHVDIDLGCDAKGRKERLRKVRSMIAALQEVEKALAEYKFGKAKRHEF
jgi:hypothetical protein